MEYTGSKTNLYSYTKSGSSGFENEEILIRAEDLKITFFTPAGQVKAVNGISYELRRGEVLGIVGESGSGKSVAVNALMKLTPYPGRVVGGSMHFKGRDIMRMSKKEIRGIRGKDIAMIFQDPMTSLNPVFRVGSQIIETILIHTDMTKEQARERAIEMLSMVGIDNPEQRINQYPHEFSGGMRQRVMIAMGLACSPEVLIADEPTSALDVTIQAQIMDIIKELRIKTRSAIILITHDLGLVSDICDNVIVMYGGRIVEKGTIDDIFYRTAHPYTIGLIRCLPRLDDDEKKPLMPIKGQPVDIINLPSGCAFYERCPDCREICKTEVPPTVEVVPGHFSACWICKKS